MAGQVFTTDDITPGVGGLQDVTIARLTETAKAVLYFHIGAAGTTLRNSIGFTEGTNSRGVQSFSEDGQSTSDNWKMFRDGDIMRSSNASGMTGGRNRAKHDSFITNGHRIDWKASADSDFKFSPVFFAGSDVSAVAGSIVPADSDDGNVYIANLGFIPDLVFCLGSPDDGQASNVTDDHHKMSFGVADLAGSIVQMCSASFGEHNVTTSNTVGGFFNTRVAVVPTDTGTVGFAIEITERGTGGSFGTGGFRAFTRSKDAGVTPGPIYFLAMKLDGWQVKLQQIATPTSSGSDSITGVGFTPEFSMLNFVHGITSGGENSLTVGSCAVSYGVTDGTDSSTYAVSDEDNVGTTNTGTSTTAGVVNVRDEADAAVDTATHTSFDSDGQTLSYSAADGTAYQGWGLFLTTAAVVVTGTGALTATVPTFVGVGAVEVTGTGALTATVPTFVASGVVEVTGTGALSATVPTFVSSGAVVNFIGTGALTATVPTFAGVGTVEVTGTGALVATVPTFVSSGAVVNFIGTGALTATTPTFVGSGAVANFVGTGALTATVPVFAGVGLVSVVGTGALTATVPVFVGAGAVVNFIGTGALRAAVATFVASGGVVDFIGTGALVATVPTFVSSGAVVNFIGTGALTATVPTFAGMGVVFNILGHDAISHICTMYRVVNLDTRIAR